MNESHARKLLLKKAQLEAKRLEDLLELERQVADIRFWVASNIATLGVTDGVAAVAAMHKRLGVVLDEWIGVDAKRWAMRTELYRKYALGFHSNQVKKAYRALKQDVYANPW